MIKVEDGKLTFKGPASHLLADLMIAIEAFCSDGNLMMMINILSKAPELATETRDKERSELIEKHKLVSGFLKLYNEKFLKNK